MNTILMPFDGVNIITPDHPAFYWPHNTFDGFPDCCGPGNGVLEKLVSDKIDDLNISPDCWVHDFMFGRGPRTWSHFHHSNSVFFQNIMLTNEARGGTREEKDHRMKKIIGYYMAVSSPVGAAIFFKQKVN